MDVCVCPIDPLVTNTTTNIAVQEGVRCNLITGEDRREVPDASHASCTVEMANLNKRYDVAVIDEIQVGMRESVGERCLHGANSILRAWHPPYSQVGTLCVRRATFLLGGHVMCKESGIFF